VSGAQFLCQEGLPTGSCPGRCGARIATVFAVTTVILASQAAVNDRCAESRSSSTTTTTKTGRIKRWRRSGNALYFDARRSPPTLTVPRSRQRAQSPRTDLRRCRGPSKAQCRFRVTQQRQQPPGSDERSPACVGATNNGAATVTVHLPALGPRAATGGASGPQQSSDRAAARVSSATCF